MDMLRHMRVFVAVAETGHFGEAARRVESSQPAVSQTLRRLEHELGVDLIRRTQRGAELTDAGRVLLPRARLLVEDADRLTADARRVAGTGETVHWGITDLGGRLVAATCATRISERRGEHRGTVGTTSDLIDAVAAGSLDLAIVERPALLSGVESTTSIAFGRHVAAPAEHPYAGTERPRLAMLADLDWAGPARAANPAGFDQLVDGLRAVGLDPSPVAVSTTQETCILVAGHRAFALTTDPGVFASVPGVAVRPAPDRLVLRLQVIYRSPESGELAEQLASDLWRLSKATR